MKQILSLVIVVLFYVSSPSQSRAKYLELGKTEMANHNYDEAIKLFSKSIKKNQKKSESYFARGLCYNLLQHYDKSISDFTEAEKLGNRDAKLYTLRAFAYSVNEKNDLALQDLDKAIAIDPEAYIGNYYNRAMLQLSFNKYDLALQDLNDYLARAEDPNGYHERGKTLMSKGDLKAACEDFRKSAALGNTDEKLLKATKAICK